MYTEGFVRGAARQPRPVAGGAVYTVRVPRHRRGRQPVVLGGQRDALPVGEVAGEVQPEVILGGACGIAGGLFEMPFIYTNDHFTKPGSGQT